MRRTFFPSIVAIFVSLVDIFYARTGNLRAPLSVKLVTCNSRGVTFVYIFLNFGLVVYYLVSYTILKYMLLASRPSLINPSKNLSWFLNIS